MASNYAVVHTVYLYTVAVKFGNINSNNNKLFGPFKTDQSSFPWIVHFVWAGVNTRLNYGADQTISGPLENVGLVCK